MPIALSTQPLKEFSSNYAFYLNVKAEFFERNAPYASCVCILFKFSFNLLITFHQRALYNHLSNFIPYYAVEYAGKEVLHSFDIFSPTRKSQLLATLSLDKSKMKWEGISV